MPVGLVGLMIAAMFAAAMSTAAGELSALSTATVIDFYRRHSCKDATDAHYLMVSKAGDGRAGGCSRASCRICAANQGSLIEVVNRYGSFFYGSMLGVFILAIVTKRATDRRVLGADCRASPVGADVGHYAVRAQFAFLWHNLIGAARGRRRRAWQSRFVVPGPAAEHDRR